MKILVIGGAGYVGQALVNKLISKGYDVTVVDNLTHNQVLSFDEKYLVKGDIRDASLMKKLIAQTDCVIHLAAIVGDAACDSNKEISTKINFLATKEIAELCYNYRKKLIFASSCSVYGAIEEGILTETSKAFPLTIYSLSKLGAEESILKLADSDFKPLILRFGTIYGLSPRMRFDLVVNSFIAKAISERKITVYGGEQWRPFVHIDDVVDSYLSAIKCNRTGIFNVGGCNYKIKDLAKKIQKEFNCKVETFSELTDKRNYKVSSEKAKKEMGLHFKHNIESAIGEMREFFGSGNIDYKSDKYTNSRVMLK